MSVNLRQERPQGHTSGFKDTRYTLSNKAERHAEKEDSHLRLGDGVEYGEAWVGLNKEVF